jgi:hypothetical protein
LGFACAGSLASHSAEAAPKVAVSYQADPSCPDAAEFVQAAMERSDGVVLEPTEDPAIASATVDLRARGDEFVGHLTLRAADIDRVRDVTATSCRELAAAIAFVLGLAAAKNELRDESLAAQPAAPEAAPGSSPKAAPQTHGFDAWLVADVGVRSGISPGVVVTEAAVGELRSVDRVAPAIRIGVARTERGQVLDPAAYRAEFDWWGGRLEGCPVQIAVGRMLGLRPCAGVQVGSLNAKGIPTSGGSQETASRVETEVTLSIQGELRLLGPLSFLIGLDALVPFSRPWFYFEGDSRTNVHRPDIVSGAAFAELKLRVR